MNVLKKLLFIYNLRAGKGELGQKIPEILEIFAKENCLVTVCPTLARGDATRFARELAPSFDRIVCAGGDGTLNEVVAGLMELERRPPLGYIPAGTTNDFSKNLNLPKGFPARAAAAVSGTEKPCDVGSFNGRPFIYVAAFGAFTAVSYNTPQEFKNMFGHLAYLLEGVNALGSIRGYRMSVRHDGGVLEGEFLFGMASNTVSIGGFQGVLPMRAELDDGLFEVLLVRNPKNAAELTELLRALALQEISQDGFVIALRTSVLEVMCEEKLPWTLDGEFGGDPLRSEIRNLRHAVTLMQGK